MGPPGTLCMLGMLGTMCMMCMLLGVLCMPPQLCYPAQQQRQVLHFHLGSQP